MKHSPRLLFSILAILLAFTAPLFAEEQPAANENAKAHTVPISAEALKDWTTQGDVRFDGDELFKSDPSLAISKSTDTLLKPATATSPSFPVAPGPWEIRGGARASLESMDNSYNATLNLEVLDTAGKVLENTILHVGYQGHNWRTVFKNLDFPQGAAAARFVVKINKETPGTFWVSALSAYPAKNSAAKMRLLFRMAALGHLLKPEDAREGTVEVWSSRPLKDLNALVSVRDFWGAEMGEAIPVKLSELEKTEQWQKYSGPFDLAKLPLEIGRYYDLHGSIPREDAGAEPYTDTSSFTILPEAPANKFAPMEIPFTSHSWDDRVKEHILLSHRLGLRITGIVFKNDPKDTTKLELPHAELAKELGMGILTSSTAMWVERRIEGYDSITPETEAALRQSARIQVEKFGHIKPHIIKMGNEPHNQGEGIKVNTEAYRIIYSEFKKLDPEIKVVGSSIGPQEEYFQAGFGEWCDAYDLHTYESPEDLRKSVEVNYPRLIGKYGHKKPIWATEVGLNSQGMSRHAVASTVMKKFANFFAGGGENISWFSLLYPDPEGKIAETDPFSAAHNVFDSRWLRYAPKMDAIAYYNGVNSILDKKAVERRDYPGEAQLFLFRNAKGDSLIVGYQRAGRQDVFLPLPEVGAVKMIRVDGRITDLDAQKKGVTLTLDEDPLILLYTGGAEKLPETLGAPAITLAGGSESFVAGTESTVGVALAKDGGVDPAQVDLLTPPLWTVAHEAADDHKMFRFTIPAESAARAADLVINAKSADGKVIASLTYRPEITGSITAELQPIAFGEKAGPGARLVIRNNGAKAQKLAWNISVDQERELKGGRFADPVPAGAYFAEASSGSVTVESGKSASLEVPFADLNPLKVYLAKAVVRDENARSIVVERPLAGFVGVPRAATPPTLDGTLDEGAWENIQPIQVGKASEYYFLFKDSRIKSKWDDPEDLSAKIRFLWDNEHLYLGLEVTDDLGGALVSDGEYWKQDGLQLLIDPKRNSVDKPGKYDYSIGLGKNGPGASCHLSGDPATKTGPTPEIKVSAKRTDPNTGSITYEVAIPWSKVAPFTPGPNANLGMHMAFNEDDGDGRGGYLSWFGNVQTKDVNTVGDLILLP